MSREEKLKQQVAESFLMATDGEMKAKQELDDLEVRRQRFEVDETDYEVQKMLLTRHLSIMKSSADTFSTLFSYLPDAPGDGSEPGD